MDHDRNFKQLLSTFFAEFIEAFLPAATDYIEFDSPIELLDKELFTDVDGGDRHAVDLVAKVRFRGQDGFFLIHVENQANTESEFPMRMFSYFARLHAKFRLPVYPVVVFSHNAPSDALPDVYQVDFPDRSVLQFNYTVIQLNRLSWRDYVNRRNPVAIALMSKMEMAPAERPRVKLECLRLLATLKLDPAKSRLIGAFIEAYLKLTRAEMRQYEREMEQLSPDDREATMELMTHWHIKGQEEGRKQGRQEGRQEGRQQGIAEGKETLIYRQIKRRLGEISNIITERIDLLNADQLDELGEALFDFTCTEDVEIWLTRYGV